MLSMHKMNKSVKIGVWGGLIASLCCVTPLVIVLFGLGSLSFALGFTKYKSIFTILGVLFVGIAITMNFRKKTCSADPNEMKRRKVFVLVIVLTMASLYFLVQYLILPFLGRIIYSL